MGDPKFSLLNMRGNIVVFYGNITLPAVVAEVTNLTSDYQKQVSRVIWLSDESQQNTPCFTSFEIVFYLDNLRAQYIKYVLVVKYILFHVISSRNSDPHRTSNSSEGGQKEGNQPCHLYLEQHLLLKLT